MVKNLKRKIDHNDNDSGKSITAKNIKSKGTKSKSTHTESTELVDAAISDDDAESFDGSSDNDTSEGEGLESSEDESEDEVKKNKKVHSEKAPTADELRELSVTPKIFRSNLIKLEIEELLNETRITPQSSKTKDLEAVMKRLVNFIENTPEVPELPLKQAIQNLYTKSKSASSKISTQYKAPFLKPALDTTHFLVKYKPPLKIAVVGSYALGLATRSRFGFNVDIAIQMPTDLFTEKDYLNYRYFYKRSYYIGCLLSALNDNEELTSTLEFDYDYLRGDERLPVIVCYNKKISGNKTEKSSSNSFCFRLIPCISPETFSRDKLSPCRNHVRLNYIKNAWLPKKDSSTTDDSESASVNPPTPNYNSALISEIQYFSHMSFLHNLCKQSPGFKDAVILSKVWISQRGFGKRVTNPSLKSGEVERDGVVNGFLITMILAWLICGNRGQNSKKTPVLSTGLSSFQMFKSLLSFISNDLISESKSALEFRNSQKESALSEKFSLAEFTNNFDHTFVDPSGHLNLMSRVRPWELKRLQIEAANTLSTLDADEEKGFFSVFIDYVDNPLCVYDHLYKLEFDSSLYQLDQQLYHNFIDSDESSLNWKMLDEANIVSYLQNQIVSILSQGLGNRALLIEARQSELISHLSKPPSSSNIKPNLINKKITFLVGIIVNKSEASKLVTLGPQPPAASNNSQSSILESESFENLWGEKSELRRFKDGSIRLSTVWGSSDSSPFERSGIVPKMISFLLMRHFKLGFPDKSLANSDLLALKCNSKSIESLNVLKALGKHFGGKASSLSTDLPRFLQTIDEAKCVKKSSSADIYQQIPKPFLDFETTQKYFIEWTKKVINLGDNLPLQISSIRTTSPFLRGTSVTVPKQTYDNDDTYLYAIDTILEFETSTKWPDEILALQKVKTAFLQKLGEVYCSSNSGASFNIVCRNYGHSDSESNNFILVDGVSPLTIGNDGISESSGDLLTHEQDLVLEIVDSSYTGFIYRVYLKLDREKFFYDRMLKQFKASTPMGKDITSKKAKVATLTRQLRHWNRVYEWRAKHHYEVDSFSKTHYPTFATTCRLFKRWLSCHFLLLESGEGYISSHGVHGVPEEIAELIVASVFSNKSYDFKVYLNSPNSVTSAFIRVLELLAKYKFNEFPLLVNMSLDLDDDDIIPSEDTSVDWSVANEHFNNCKKSKTFGGMYVMSPKNQNCEWFGHISALVTNQLKKLATASLSTLEDLAGTGNTNLAGKIFSSPADKFDFKLVLDPEFCTRSFQAISPLAFKQEPDRYLRASDFTKSKNKIDDLNLTNKGDIGKEDDLGGYKNIELAIGGATEGDDYDGKKSVDILQIASKHTRPNPFGLPKMIAFDPASKLKSELELIYNKSAVFFRDIYGGNVIYGLWTPLVHKINSETSKLKANLGLNIMPTKSKDSVKVNIDAILCEILHLGEDLISEVSVK
ncbi:Nucleolar protein 6 [Smittium culicis]|uniref:Nucleolar protein 6 n=1 Tax=Smittium culicis TaxID=133412 RepID=A0A1R1XRB6_9FUNG|nr:Nucleolar protein 6 [Smittium culicis]